MTIDTVSSFPTAPSRSTDTPAEFRTKADAWVGHMVTFTTEINTTIGQINVDTAQVTADKNAAAASAAAAAVSEAQAVSASNVAPYNAGTTYDPGDTVSGSDGATYRRINTSASGDNPVGSATGNWVRLTSLPHTTEAKTANYTITASEILGDRTFTNSGAAGAIEFDLPAGATSAKVRFIVVAGQYLRVNANGSETIRFGGTATAAGGYIRSNKEDTSWTIEWDGAAWVIADLTGTLKYDA